MTRPRIAIPIPTSFDREYNQRSWPQYAEAVERSGGSAVEVSLHLSPADAADLIDTCQGVLLPGSGADLNPQKYGQEPVEACAAPDPAREAVDELLIQDAHNLYKPIFAICFGHQSLNVWRGGSLIQDLTVMPVNHPAGRAVAVAHTVAIAPDSTLGRTIVSSEAALDTGFMRLPVNSSHHQAVGVPGDGLRVVARCPQDGVIEALEGSLAQDEGQMHFVLGVQWHPERSFESSASSRAIFSRFVAEASAWKPRSISVSVA